MNEINENTQIDNKSTLYRIVVSNVASKEKIFYINIALSQQAIKKFLEYISVINYYQPCINIEKFENNYNLVLMCEDPNLLILVKWLVNNYWSLANNKVCSYEVSQLPRSMQTLDDNQEISNYTDYDANRAKKFTSDLPKHLLDFSDADCANPANVMGKFALAYNMYHQTNCYHKSQILMSTGTPGFKPFYYSEKSFSQAIANEKDETYAQYGLPIPGRQLTDAVNQFLKQHQLILNHTKIAPYELVLGNGSTHLYNMLLSSIINKGDIVLMPRPCYGLFVGPVYDCHGEVGFIDLDENGKISLQRLKLAIEYYQQKLIEKYILTHLLVRLDKITRYFILNQHQTNNVLIIPHLSENFDESEFRKYIDSVNTLISEANLPKDLQLPHVPRVKAFFHMNPHNPAGSVYSQREIDEYAQMLSHYPEITIIDDLAHYDIYFSSKKLGNFSNTMVCKNNVVTLISMSKGYCQANMRAAFAYGTPQIIGHMQVKLMSSTFSMSYPAEKALMQVLQAPHDKRVSYITKNRNEYLFRKDLTRLLIYGFVKCDIPYLQKLALAQYLYTSLKEAYPTASTEILAKLLAGVPYLQTTYEPHGCFFYLVNVKDMIGLRIGRHILNSSLDIRNALLFFEGIDSIPGELSANIENFTLRISYSIPRHEIVDAFFRVHSFINIIRTKEGSIPLLTRRYLESIQQIRENKPLLDALVLADKINEAGVAKKMSAFNLFKPHKPSVTCSHKYSTLNDDALSSSNNLNNTVVRLKNIDERMVYIIKENKISVT